MVSVTDMEEGIDYYLRVHFNPEGELSSWHLPKGQRPSAKSHILCQVPCAFPKKCPPNGFLHGISGIQGRVRWGSPSLRWKKMRKRRKTRTPDSVYVTRSSLFLAPTSPESFLEKPCSFLVRRDRHPLVKKESCQSNLMESECRRSSCFPDDIIVSTS